MKKNTTQPALVDRMIKEKVSTKDGVIIKVGRRKIYSAGETLEMQFPISSARSIKNEKCC